MTNNYEIPSEPPIGRVVRDVCGDRWIHRDDGWHIIASGWITYPKTWARLLDWHGPLTGGGLA
jgi:hypothetical protein